MSGFSDFCAFALSWTWRIVDDKALYLSYPLESYKEAIVKSIKFEKFSLVHIDASCKKASTELFSSFSLSW